MIYKQILLITFLNETGLIFLPTVKWFQELLCISNNLTLVICLHTFKLIYVHDISEIRLSVTSFLNDLELIWLHTILAFVST